MCAVISRMDADFVYRLCSTLALPPPVARVEYGRPVTRAGVTRRSEWGCDRKGYVTEARRTQIQ